MRKIFAIVAAVLLIAAVLCGCGNKTVTTSVDAKYVDDFAKNYASDVKADDNGNVSYEFTPEKYEEFISDYNRVVRDESLEDLNTGHQYVYLSQDGAELSVGVKPDEYDEDTCRAEAEQMGKDVMKYNMNVENPTGKISVTFENANTGDEYFTIEVTED